MKTHVPPGAPGAAGPRTARLPRREGPSLRRDALQRWDWEGGGTAVGMLSPAAERPAPERALDCTGTELAQLRMRVVALENLMLALLMHGSVDQRAAADAMARYIRPRPGFTAHPLTLRAASRMLQMVQRASTLRVAPPRH